MPKCRKPPKLFSAFNTTKPSDVEKNKHFISCVCQWYWNFGASRPVTMAELKTVGALIAERLEITPPPQWLSIVRKKHGVQLEPYNKKAKVSPMKSTDLGSKLNKEAMTTTESASEADCSVTPKNATDPPEDESNSEIVDSSACGLRTKETAVSSPNGSCSQPEINGEVSTASPLELTTDNAVPEETGLKQQVVSPL